MNAHPWGVADINVFYKSIGKVDQWDAKAFFDRWTQQPNYPLLKIELVTDPADSSRQMLNVKQSRALNSNSSVFAGDLLYPSAYEYVDNIHLKQIRRIITS